MVDRDPCKNPDCRFYDTCPLRPSPHLPVDPNPPRQPTPARAAWYAVDSDYSGRIGRLHIRGEIAKPMLPILAQFERLLAIVDGAFVVFNSPGGNAFVESRLVEVLETASATMPTVAYLRQACSAAFIASMAASRIYARPDARLGGLGVLCRTCDGYRPTTLVSAQTPAKTDGRPLAPWIFAKMTDHAVLQDSLDASFYETIKEVCRHRGCSIDSIVRLLDGRIFPAKQAHQAGLIDGVVLGETEAFEKLSILIHERKQKCLRKKAS